jgi:protein arginine kinase activator
MQCQICHKNEATIHLTEITAGSRTEMHICEQCAAQQDINVKSHIPINELLSNLLASAPSDEEIHGPADTTEICPNCGITLGQFSSDGLLGCPYDYEFFDKELTPLVARAHNGNTNHRGKVPSRAPREIKSQMEMFELRRRLQDALEDEDYELAAKLRDNIKKYENRQEQKPAN